MFCYLFTFWKLFCFICGLIPHFRKSGDTRVYCACGHYVFGKEQWEYRIQSDCTARDSGYHNQNQWPRVCQVQRFRVLPSVLGVLPAQTKRSALEQVLYLKQIAKNFTINIQCIPIKDFQLYWANKMFLKKEKLF